MWGMRFALWDILLLILNVQCPFSAVCRPGYAADTCSMWVRLWQVYDLNAEGLPEPDPSTYCVNGSVVGAVPFMISLWVMD